MKFTGTYTGIKFDLSAYQRRLETYLVELLHLGAKDWLKVVAGNRGRVPVWTGMARASLLELSELINGTILISPLKGKSRIQRGRALGTAVQEISKSNVKLTIQVSVPHYVEQERSSGRSPSAPWRSFSAGILAFRQATADAKLPSLDYRPIHMKV